MLEEVFIIRNIIERTEREELARKEVVERLIAMATMQYYGGLEEKFMSIALSKLGKRGAENRCSCVA